MDVHPNSETLRQSRALIREARASDAAAIAHVHIESSQDAYAPLAKDWPAPDLAGRTARWASSLEASADSKRIDLVATLEGTVIGFIGAGPARRKDVEAQLEIYVVHVHPEYRGKGVGNQLWSAVCERLRDETLPAMYLETFAELRCCSFYEAHGGVVRSRTPETFHGGMVTKIVYIWPAGKSNERILLS
jgi:ribosomal protein S18 acetylase RimI-like enzyme